MHSNVKRTSQRNGANGVAVLAAITTVCLTTGCTRPGDIVTPDAGSGPGGLCIGPTCLPDPGWGPVDCTQQDGVDTLSIDNFDGTLTNSSGTFVAQDFYVYSDGTSPPTFENYAHEPISDAGGFQPPTTPLYLCGPDAGSDPRLGTHSRVLHLFGGPFLGWGGGTGIAMAKLNGRDMGGRDNATTGGDPNSPKNICESPGPDGGYPSICPPLSAEFSVQVAAVDVSQYEGVSFWARRGPNGQATFHVNVGDKYTDDDLNYLGLRQQAQTGQPQSIYCQRIRECDCLNHQACTFLQTLPSVNTPPPLPAGQGFFCGPPPSTANLSSACQDMTLACVGLNGGPNTCCSTTACNQPYPAYPCDHVPDAGIFAGVPANTDGDIQFYGRPCTPYGWTNGIGGSFCFDPATDPPPAPPAELCGDHWQIAVDLGTDWKFYKVPFTSLLQQGFAKKSEHLDLTAVSVVKFTWGAGWIDYWLDNVAFYRSK